MKCEKCGKINPDDVSYCGGCGYHLVYEEHKTNTEPEEKQTWICEYCSAENNDGIKHCRVCGQRHTNTVQRSSIFSTTSGTTLSVGNPDKLIKKLVCMLGGLAGAIVGLFIINSEKEDLFGYTYTAPFTDHEIFMIAVVVVSVIVFIIGCKMSSYD